MPKLKTNLTSPDSYVSLALGLAVVLVIGMIIINYFRTKGQITTKPASQKEEQKAEVSKSLPSTYTVKDGDTLWSIAELYYKSGYNWVDLQKANNLVSADYIQSGMTLTIPDVKPIEVAFGQISSASTQISANRKTYTVIRGDSLWKIAVEVYGNGFRWTEIAKLNNLANPDLIHSGNVFQLP